MSSTNRAEIPGSIVVLNGAPRSGKSSVADAIIARAAGDWINLGVDTARAILTPARLQPGIGLRPGGERPDLEGVVPRLYQALYETIAAHSRAGLNVVVDVGHHDHYSRSLAILPRCARRLAGLPAFLVGIRCSIDVIMDRRRQIAVQGGDYAASPVGEEVPAPVILWQEAVHRPGHYDLEVDTSSLSPGACAERILALLDAPPAGPRALERLARTATD